MLTVTNLAQAVPQAFVKQIAGGGSHTCALTNSGGVRCWGDNSNGQLGDGTTSNSNIPVEVLGLSLGVIAVATGGNHSCALMSDGAVRCWGSNIFGQLGDSTTKNRSIAVDVRGLGGGVTKIVAGGLHTCALVDTGGVKCWGSNISGQLGDGARAPGLTPIEVSGLGGVTTIAAGADHTCALTSSGGVQCWGKNDSGKLGDGTTTDRWAPVDVTGLSSGVTAVAAGTGHTCALTSGGSVRCWGLNFFGQLGDGTTIGRLTPAEVSTLDSGVTAILAGGNHGCALAGAAIKCWGANQLGQLGDPTTTEALTPVDVKDLNASITAITAGSNHSCALTDIGTVKCWGNNGSGQLGGGTTPDQTAPVEVSGLNVEPSSIAAGGSHTCLRMGVKFKCWGSNNSGQLGDGTTIDRVAPIEASNQMDITAITNGGNHTCVLTIRGGVSCWGSNRYGQLGDNSITDRFVSVDVTDLSANVTAVSTGANHSCALLVKGNVRCWGANRSGELGDGSTIDQSTPVQVTDLSSGIIAISIGAHHSCALNGKGGVTCWGSNRLGQLGDGTTVDSLTPISVFNLDNDVIGIAAGRNHTCALNGKGAVKCWGDNSVGQLGDGTTIDRLTPVDVASMSEKIIAIAAGGNHTCALTDAGAVKCWGSNTFGQIGDGTSVTRLMPIDVSGMSGEIIAIAAGENHTCVLNKENGVKCWGSNQSGQLGDGTNIDRLMPTVLPGITQLIEFDASITQIPYADTIVAYATASSGLPVAFDSLTTSTCTVAGASLVTAIGRAGELCVIRAQQAGNGSFFPAAADIRSFQIIPATQTITFLRLPNRAIASGALILLTNLSSAGLPVKFTSQTPAICTTSGSDGTTVTLITEGICTIRASQLGDNNFAKANDVDQSFSVTSTSNEDSNTDWWQWRGGSGCTIHPNARFDWSFAVLLFVCVGLRLRR